jgi:hypothetical protein
MMLGCLSKSKASFCSQWQCTNVHGPKKLFIFTVQIVIPKPICVGDRHKLTFWIESFGVTHW